MFATHSMTDWLVVAGEVSQGHMLRFSGAVLTCHRRMRRAGSTVLGGLLFRSERFSANTTSSSIPLSNRKQGKSFSNGSTVSSVSLRCHDIFTTVASTVKLEGVRMTEYTGASAILWR
jgi:hypothetical protein